MKQIKAPVLVIGGGPVGLWTALHLAALGVRSILIEKHPETSHHPKASYFNTRTLELLQDLGIAEEFYASAMFPDGVSFYTNMRGHRLGSLQIGDNPEYLKAVMGATATPGCVSSQVILESILKRHADENDLIEVLFGHEKLSLNQAGDGVDVRVLNRDTGEEMMVQASYVIACDGVHSSTRSECGRKLVGPPAFGHIINIYIEADIESLVEEKNQALYWIATPSATGVFIGLGGDRQKWCFNTPYFPQRGETPEDYSEQRCLDLVHKALGTDQLEVRVLAIGPWVLCGQVIDEFRDSRVFFGGDAAHLNIPTGGFGLNTGMQETHNLAWKLAGVLEGWAPEAILDTYHQERRPIAVFNVEKSRENAVRIRDTGAVLGEPDPEIKEIEDDTARGRAIREQKGQAIIEQADHFLFLGQEIGFGYWDSPIVTSDGTPHYAEAHCVDNAVSTYVSNARPGARAPHCWVTTKDAPETPQSILRQYGREFVLLCRGEGSGWADTVTDAVGNIPLVVHSVGPPGSEHSLIDINEQWSEFYGIADTGAVLVRPDGHVCWRTTEAPTSQTDTRMVDALEKAVGRTLQENPK
ncbi:MAG: putative polyketide hydroxylase [Hyphomicrobiaceae bacterium]|jgi:putative polyketide hydroxylase